MEHQTERSDDNGNASRAADLRGIVAMATIARDDALRLGLRFEAYLLDMAILSLSEHSEECSAHHEKKTGTQGE